MAEGFTAAGAATALDALKAAYPWIKLCIGAPGPTGTANAATETTRKQATWGTTTAGAFSNTDTLDWTNVAGTEDYTHFAAYSASSGGTCGFTGTITANPVVTGDNFSFAPASLTASVPLAT